MRIAVLPIGSVDSSILEDLRFSLSEVFSYTDAFILKDSLHLPKETYARARALLTMRVTLPKVMSSLLSTILKVDLPLVEAGFILMRRAQYLEERLTSVL